MTLLEELEKRKGRRKDQRLVTYMGETLSIAEWAKLYQIDYGLLYDRWRAGWDFHEALHIPLGAR